MQAPCLVQLAEGMEAAISREKQIKGGSRARKVALIEATNPEWQDMFDELAHP
jgi:predicted GIY-YIG superfamily endonuclease